MPNEEEKHKLIKFIDKYKKSEEYKEKEHGAYKFIPLNYPKNPKVGFEVFSKGIVNNKDIAKKKILRKKVQNIDTITMKKFQMEMVNI